MFLRHTLHNTHYEQVMVVREVYLLEDGRHLELVRSHLVMACTNRNTGFERFVLQLLHERQHARRNSTEIMILQLLTLGAIMPH